MSGNYKNVYKIKNIQIAQTYFSLFDIENEFIRAGKKNKALCFKKSNLKKDNPWLKLKPIVSDPRAIFCLYHGLYGLPPYQVVENANIQPVFNASKMAMDQLIAINNQKKPAFYDWLKPYHLK